jgi:hypothetical protein
MGTIFLIVTLRNQLQPAVRCYLRICMEGMKRTVINIRILASGPRIKSETSEIQIRIAVSKL